MPRRRGVRFFQGLEESVRRLTGETLSAGDYEHLNNLAAHLDTLRNLDGREFEVVRIPQPPFTYGGPAGTINYTYTNSQILNDKVLVPIYGFESDAEALQLYADLMPGYEIIGIDSSFIIQYWGAIHCVANTLHGENPLVVLHEPLTSVPSGSPVTVAFRINPRFTDTTAAVYYRQTGELEFTEATAEFADGVWTAILPPVSEDFAYYLAGHAVSGDSDYLVTLPDDAPAIMFDVTVGQSTAVPGVLTARAVLSTCSSVSTAQGPAIIASSSPPMVTPPTSTRLSSVTSRSNWV